MPAQMLKPFASWMGRKRKKERIAERHNNSHSHRAIKLRELESIQADTTDPQDRETLTLKQIRKDSGEFQQNRTHRHGTDIGRSAVTFWWTTYSIQGARVSEEGGKPC